MTDAVFNPDELREDIEIEAKRATGRDGRGQVPKDLWETYSAFANTDGGEILLGVSEGKGGKYVIEGIKDPQRLLTEFWTLANNPQKVSRNILDLGSVTEYSTPNGLSVLGIHVPRASRSERPVYINGNPLTGTYKRLHDSDFRCTEEEVKRMLAEQTEDARDGRLLKNFNFYDIDEETYRAYRNRLAALKPDHPFNGRENLEFLQGIGAWSKDRTSGDEGLTLAGLLMFGKYEVIQDAVSNYFVDYRELPSSGSRTEWVDRLTPDGTWSGNLYDFYRLVIQRLFRDLKVPFRLDKDEREDDTPIHKALREALVNAIVHADYSARVSILAVKAPDFFGFRNPGLMRIPIHIALDGGQSDCRNRNLQRMFSLIGLGEQAGSGIPRVVENWKAQHYRDPELWESKDPESTLMRLRTVSLLPDETLQLLDHRFGEDFKGLSENERLALATAQIEGFVTNGRLQQISRLHPRDITDLLRNLVSKGMLVHDGQGRGTTYRVAGSAAVDLAHSIDFEQVGEPPRSSTVAAGDVGPSSTHLQDSSSHLDPSSSHSEERYEPGNDPRLLEIAKPVRDKGKADKDLVNTVILELCAGKFLTIQQLGSLLNRSPQGLRERYVKPLLDEDKLERRYPEVPNHEQQAYRTRDGEV